MSKPKHCYFILPTYTLKLSISFKMAYWVLLLQFGREIQISSKKRFTALTSRIKKQNEEEGVSNNATCIQLEMAKTDEKFLCSSYLIPHNNSTQSRFNIYQCTQLAGLDPQIWTVMWYGTGDFRQIQIWPQGTFTVRH